MDKETIWGSNFSKVSILGITGHRLQTQSFTTHALSYSSAQYKTFIMQLINNEPQKAVSLLLCIFQSGVYTE